MSWGNPLALHLLWLAPLVAAALWGAWRSRRSALQRLGPIAAERVSDRALRVHAWRLGLWWVALVLGVVALAQPRWGYRWQELKREGLDLVVLLDVSRSMDATDISPSRMERARREVLDLVELLAGDRVALVIFAGGAFPRMPLTLDYGVLTHVVRDSATESLVAQGSDLGAAMEAGLALLGDKGAADRAMLLITDGEDHEGRALEVAERVAAADVHLYVLGVGTTDGAPIPVAGGGFKKDKSGRMVLSKLDEDLLTEIARAGKGAYVRSGGGNQDLRAIYEGEIRGRLQGAEDGVRREKVWDERFQWPLGAAVLLLLGAGLLRPGRLRIPGGAAAALLAVLALPARAEAPDPAAAVDRLAAEQARQPDDPALAEQLGVALHQAGRHNEAHGVFTSLAERAVEPDRRQRARYNAGLAAYRSGRLTRAAEDWQRLLQEAPEGPIAEQAQKNLQLVQQELARRTGQEPPPQNGDQQGDPQQGDQQGEPQPGEQQGEQQGESQEGDPQPGEPQGDPQEGDGTNDAQPDDAGEPSSDPPTPGTADELQRNGAESQGEPEGINDAQATGEEGADTGAPEAATAAEDGEDAPQRPGSIAAGEAEKMLDSVQEGSPRVRARRRAVGEKDW
jgi:Ca-activated chloride channel family protein